MSIKFINLNTYEFINCFSLSVYRYYDSNYIKYLTFNVFDSKRTSSFKTKKDYNSFISFNISYYYHIYEINNFKNILTINFIKEVQEGGYYNFIKRNKWRIE